MIIIVVAQSGPRKVNVMQMLGCWKTVGIRAAHVWISGNCVKDVTVI